MSDGAVEVEGPARDRGGVRVGRAGWPVGGFQASQVAALEDRMGRDGGAVLEDEHLARVDLHVEHAGSRVVGHAVQVAADGHHAVAGDPALDGEWDRVGDGGRRGEVVPLVGHRLGDHAAGGAVRARVGDAVAPVVELRVQISRVAEAAAKVEVLSDVPEGPLDLALGLGPARLAAPGHGAVVPEQVHQRGLEDGRPVGTDIWMRQCAEACSATVDQLVAFLSREGGLTRQRVDNYPWRYCRDNQRPL